MSGMMAEAGIHAPPVLRLHPRRQTLESRTARERSTTLGSPSLGLEHWERLCKRGSPCAAARLLPRVGGGGAGPEGGSGRAGEAPAALTCPGAWGSAQAPNAAGERGWVRSHETSGARSKNKRLLECVLNSSHPTLTTLRALGGGPEDAPSTAQCEKESSPAPSLGELESPTSQAHGREGKFSPAAGHKH